MWKPRPVYQLHQATNMNRIHSLFAILVLATSLLTFTTGCGFERLAAPLPNLVPGLTLEQLEDIQNDTGLTDDERRAMIRDAIGAPEDADGDRLVEFLLTFNVP